MRLGSRGCATASAEQVKKPIYTTSVGRSEPYRELLKPFSDVLTRHSIVDVEPSEGSH